MAICPLCHKVGDGIFVRDVERDGRHFVLAITMHDSLQSVFSAANSYDLASFGHKSVSQRFTNTYIYISRRCWRETAGKISPDVAPMTRIFL